MHYSLSLMPQFIGRKVSDNKPVWCVVEEYEPHEREYLLFPKGRKYLTGPGLMNITKSQAEERAGQLTVLERRIMVETRSDSDKCER